MSISHISFYGCLYFFSFENFLLYFCPPLPLPFWKKKKKNLTKRRLTLQILAILQIHFWSLLCKEKWKQRINLKVQFSDVPLWGSGVKDPALSPQWPRSLLWSRFDAWSKNCHMPWQGQKEKFMFLTVSVLLEVDHWNINISNMKNHTLYLHTEIIW